MASVPSFLLEQGVRADRPSDHETHRPEEESKREAASDRSIGLSIRLPATPKGDGLGNEEDDREKKREAAE